MLQEGHSRFFCVLKRRACAPSLLNCWEPQLTRSALAVHRAERQVVASLIPAYVGNNQRHRLYLGGARQLNQSLHNVVLVRMRIDADTRAYVEKRIKEGKSKREVLCCLKRHLARKIHCTLVTKQTRTLNPESIKNPA